MTPSDVRQTRASFDYQWSRLSAGQSSLADPEFKEALPAFICRLTQLDPQWFAGKQVLDAGCGTGRHAFGLCRLGARVTAVDASMPALRRTRENCAGSPGFMGAVAADLLAPLPLDAVFDLVWSYGVLHHTGDTRRAFQNIAGHVRHGGYLFVMLYGAPRPDRFDDHQDLASIVRWRLRCEAMTFAEKVHVLKQVVPDDRLLEYFDVVSPWINDTLTYEELRGWCGDLGFTPRRLVDERDHYIIARRSGG